MLNRLVIKNFAIIDELSIDFSDNLNLITGETGAGKSILLGALSLLLGQKMDSKTILRKEEKCIIEGHFFLKGYNLRDTFEDLDLDYEDYSLLRREISSEGKSRAFINDSPVSLITLQEIGNRLIDIHSQHETLEINQESFQVKVLDSFANQIEILEKYKIGITEYRKKEKRINKLKEELGKNSSEIDFLEFQLNEFEKAKIEESNEQENLEKELLELTHADEIQKGLFQFISLADGEDGSILNSIKHSIQLLSGIEKYYPEIKFLLERIKASQIEIRDLVSDSEALVEKIQLNPSRMETISIRLNLFNHLEQKHRVKDLTALIQIEKEIVQKLEGLRNESSEIDQLEKEMVNQKLDLESLSRQLNNGRVKVIPRIEKEIKEVLLNLGMKDSEFLIEIQSNPDVFTAYGIDRIRFLFSANKGFAPGDLSKIASGGELSRLVLAIKTLSSRYISMPTLLFDEIDTGVSGEVALKVGNVMKKLSEKNQVIAITHLPQIASREGNHYFVSKEVQAGITRTLIKKLDGENRIFEVAKMLSGNNPGEFAIKNAKELIENL